MHHEAGLALITEVHRAVHALGLAIESAAGITQAEALVLTTLYNRESVPLDEVHKTFLHRRSTLTNVLERLEASKLIRRRISTRDRRRFDLSLTPSGRKKARTITQLLSEIVESSGVSDHEAAASRQTLAKIVEVVGAEPQ